MARIKRALKVSAKDAELPRTRAELFGRIIREDFYLTVDLSLVELLFSLPLIAVLFAGYAIIASVEIKPQTVFPIVFWFALAAAVLCGIKYVGRNACFSVMKKRAHNEGCFIIPEILRSVKSSGGKSFLLGLIVGFSAFFAAAGSVYMLFFSDTFFKWVAIGALTVLFLLFYCAAEYFMASENFYDLKFFVQLKNSMLFAVAKFPASLLFFALTVGIKFAAALFSFWAWIIVSLVFSLTLSGLSVAAATLYAHAAFDKYINEKNHPDIVGKGLLKD